MAQHDHLRSCDHSQTFGQERRRPGESRTLVVLGITATMMVVEIASGLLFGSMALLADGLHMASHAAALAVNALAYVYARRHAGDVRYSFGTGKVNALGGFTGALLLAGFTLMMAWESSVRLAHPVPIAFDQAILVAVLGLVVNGVSIFVLGEPGRAGAGHGSPHHSDHDAHAADPAHDHNLRSAYLHVVTDALTSLLAIAALLAAKFFGLVWMDPLMGVVAAVLVARWSWGLLRATSGVLLDRQGPPETRARIRRSLEDVDTRVVDLHLWSLGPGVSGLIVAVVTRTPRPPEHYKALLPGDLGLAHVTVEVHTSATLPAHAHAADRSGSRA